MRNSPWRAFESEGLLIEFNVYFLIILEYTYKSILKERFIKRPGKHLEMLMKRRCQTD